MKNIIILIAGCIFVMNAVAQQTQPTQSQGSILAPSQNNSQWKDKYCAATRDGNIIVMNGKTELFVDMTLENGTIITTDGNVIKKDGTKTVLQNGECVDKNGNILGRKK